MPEFDEHASDQLFDGSDDFAVMLDRDGENVRVRIVGELDVSTVPELEQALESVPPDNDGGSVLLDLDGVAFMDSTGLAALLRAKHRFEVDGHHLAIGRCSPQVLRVFELTGMMDQLSSE
jgi:anti-sigma B factor antagonist